MNTYVGAIFETTIRGTPAGYNVPIADPLPDSVTIGNTVYYYDEYVLFPEVQLGVTGISTKETLNITSPYKVAQPGVCLRYGIYREI